MVLVGVFAIHAKDKLEDLAITARIDPLLLVSISPVRTVKVHVLFVAQYVIRLVSPIVHVAEHMVKFCNGTS